jgi:hypothetical protein
MTKAKWLRNRLNGCDWRRKNQPVLGPKREATSPFVIASPQPFDITNLTARVSFSRVILDGNKLADIPRDVTITPTPKGASRQESCQMPETFAALRRLTASLLFLHGVLV